MKKILSVLVISILLAACSSSPPTNGESPNDETPPELPLEMTTVYKGRWLWKVTNRDNDQDYIAGWVDIASFGSAENSVTATGVYYDCDFDGAIFCYGERYPAEITYDAVSTTLTFVLEHFSNGDLVVTDSDGQIEQFGSAYIIQGNATFSTGLETLYAIVELRKDGTNTPTP